MNSRHIILISLAVNVGLLATIIVMVAWMRPKRPSAPDSSRPFYVENTVTQVAVHKFNATNLLSELRKMSLGWSAIESTNYFFYIRNLRSFGCPEETIRDIILADVGKLYARRREAVLREAPPFEYWKTLGADEAEGYEAGVQDQLDRLIAERNQLVKDLLGVDFDREMAKYRGDSLVNDRLYAFLDPEKRVQVKALLGDYERMEQEIFERSGGVMMPADEALLRDLDRQKMAELAKILTPEEMAAYELNLTPLASELRYELNGFNPSPEEFQAVYRLRKSLNEALESALDEGASLGPEATERAIQDAEAALDAELRKVLGSERYAEYQKSQDPDYQFLTQWADRVQLPAGTVNQVYNIQQEAERQRRRVEGNLQLSYEQRQQAYQGIVRETERTLRNMLGQDYYQQYRNSGGQWIDQMEESDQAFELIVPEIKEVLESPVPVTPPP